MQIRPPSSGVTYHDDGNTIISSNTDLELLHEEGKIKQETTQSRY
jgi:hypothetical protein